MNQQHADTTTVSTQMTPEVFGATMFAHGAFEAVGQRRKYTGHPYIVHCVEVYQLVTQFADADNFMQLAAILHDCIEDTKITAAVIKEVYNEEVAQLVVELTDVAKPEDGNRAARVAINRAHIAKASPRAKSIKLADLISNTAAIVEHDPGFAAVYLPEKKALLEVLKEGHPDLYKMASDTLEKAMSKLNWAVPA